MGMMAQRGGRLGYLDRIDAGQAALVREVSELRASERARFFWIVGILLGVVLPILAGAQLAAIVLILRQ